jgi:hypothetical protein
MTIPFTIDSKSSRDDMLNFLSLGTGHDHRPINLNAFGTKRFKTLDSLHEELLDDDCILFYDAGSRQVIRFALNAELQIQTPHECLYEIARFKNGELSGGFRFRTLSETRKRTETPKKTILRGLKEELDYELIDEGALSPPSFEQPEDHPSSAYPGLISRVVTSRFILSLPERNLYHHGVDFEDHGTTICLCWLPWQVQKNIPPTGQL